MPESRPELLALVAGTGTGVGKTWMTATLVRLLGADGTAAVARKPAQSFSDGERLTDAHVLAGAGGEAPEVVCPPHRWYPVAMAPPMAAEVLGRPPFTIDDLADELRWPEGVDIGLVESAGGVRSPLAADGDTVALAERLGPDVVLLVAHPGLGTINDVRLSAEALRGWPTMVVLNRFEEDCDLHVRNRRWLAERDRLPVAVGAAEAAAHLAAALSRRPAARGRPGTRGRGR